MNGICDKVFKVLILACIAMLIWTDRTQIKINAQQFENNDIQQRHLGELTVGVSATYGQQVHNWGEIDRRLNKLEKRQATK